jgi:hypothetical protein
MVTAPLNFLLDDGRIWIRIHTNKDGSGSGRFKSTTTLLIGKTVPGLQSNQYKTQEQQHSPTLINRNVYQHSYVFSEILRMYLNVTGKRHPVSYNTRRLPRFLTSRASPFCIEIRMPSQKILQKNTCTKNWRGADSGPA